MYVNSFLVDSEELNALNDSELAEWSSHSDEFRCVAVTGSGRSNAWIEDNFSFSLLSGAKLTKPYPILFCRNFVRWQDDDGLILEPLQELGSVLIKRLAYHMICDSLLAD